MTQLGAILSNTPMKRQFIMTIDQFRKGVTAPADVTIGTTPTIPAFRFNATAELVSAFISLPTNFDYDIDSNLLLFWSLANTQINGDNLNVTLDYTAARAFETGKGVNKTSTQLTDSITLTTAQGLAVADVYTTRFILDRNDANNPMSEGTTGIAVEFHLTDIVDVTEIHLIGVCVSYEALQ